MLPALAHPAAHQARERLCGTEAALAGHEERQRRQGARLGVGAWGGWGAFGAVVGAFEVCFLLGGFKVATGLGDVVFCFWCG